MPTTRFHIRSELRDLVASVADAAFTLVVAPAGSGKTTLLEAWRDDLQAGGHPVAWLAMASRHEAPAVFLEDWATAVRAALGAKGDRMFERLLDALPHLDEGDPESLARHVLREVRTLDEPLILVADDFHAVSSDGATARLIDLVLREASDSVHWIVSTRGARPASAARWLASGRAVEVNADDLALRGEQVSLALSQWDVQADDLQLLLLAETGGWATGVQLACRALARIEPAEREGFVRVLGEHEDLFGYIAGEIVAGESEEVEALLGVSAILGPVPETLLLEALADAGSLDVIETAREKGLLLRRGAGVGVLPLWETFLLRRIRLRGGAEEWHAMHERLARIVAPRDPSRALEIAIAGNVASLVADLLDEHGRAWLARGRFATVESALAQCQAVPDSVVRAHLRALIVSRGQPHDGAARLEAVADAYRAERRRGDEGLALLDAFIVAGNSNQAAVVRRVGRRLLSLRRIAGDPQVRALSMIMLSAMVFSRGRPSLSMRILKRISLEGLVPTVQGAATVGMTVYGRYTDWDETRRVLDEALNDRSRMAHAPAFYLCQASRALLDGLRAEAGSAAFEEALAAARDSASAIADFRFSMTEMLCFDVLGKLELRAGHLDEAADAFERGAAQAEASSETALEAALRGQLALVHRQRGDDSAARIQAERAGDLLDVRSPDRNPLSVRFPAAVAVRAVAECGDPRRALELLERHERGFRSPFPLANHQTALLLARAEWLAGSEGRARARLAAAREIAERYQLRGFGTELDREIIAWAASTTGDPGTVRIQTLGGVEALRAGAVIPRDRWRGVTTRRLLARIVAGGGGVRREVLQADLWPDAAPKRASGSLRVALTRLRAVLGKDALDSDAERIALAPELHRASDVARLREAIRATGSAQSLLDLYPGPFTPELYDDWAEAFRGELQAEFVGEVMRRIRSAAEAGDAAAVSLACERLLDLHPLEREAWEAWARAVLALEGVPAATRVVDRGHELIERELGPGAAEGLSALRRELSSEIGPGNSGG